MASLEPYTSELVVHAHRLRDDLVPDGDFDKEAWRGATQVSFDHDWLGRIRYPEAATCVRVAWTPAYLYACFRCAYVVLNVHEEENTVEEKVGLWDRDVVEVFVNPVPVRIHHYYEFEVAPNNQWIDIDVDLKRDSPWDWSWRSGFAHATRIDTKRKLWTCEMRIPVLSMRRAAIRPGDEWRINFYRIDGPGDDTRRRFLCWSPTLSTRESDFFHVPSRFGTIRFV
ncbi:MAG: carbohydrate-binding family 9-like protein [Acidobacteriales bacterium]|nr:carbohydrate-binding family 9-like protein [Terriglobales bacterium]